MRHLFIKIHQSLFAYYLCHEESFRVVGDHVLREVHRSLIEHALQMLHQLRHVLTRESRCPVYLIKDSCFVIQTIYLQILFRVHDVDLVYDKDLRSLTLLDHVEHILVAALFRVAVHDENDSVYFIKSVRRHFCHCLAELVSSLMDSRRVDEYHLAALVFSVRHPGVYSADAVSRSLRLVGRDRDLLADHSVEKRRLADVRSADYANKT